MFNLGKKIKGTIVYLDSCHFDKYLSSLEECCDEEKKMINVPIYNFPLEIHFLPVNWLLASSSHSTNSQGMKIAQFIIKNIEQIHFIINDIE